MARLTPVESAKSSAQRTSLSVTHAHPSQLSQPRPGITFPHSFPLIDIMCARATGRKGNGRVP
jgi:hypothetical protein